MNQEKYRLITRSDFDGLVCAVLLKELGMLDEIQFVHPKDMQDGKVQVTSRDITTNLPYVPGVHMAFDHHHSEMFRLGDEKHDNHVIDPDAASAARVVYEYFGGKEKFPNVKDELMDAVDQGDAAEFSEEEVLDPENWVLGLWNTGGSSNHYGVSDPKLDELYKKAQFNTNDEERRAQWREINVLLSENPMDAGVLLYQESYNYLINPKLKGAKENATVQDGTLAGDWNAEAWSLSK